MCGLSERSCRMKHHPGSRAERKRREHPHFEAEGQQSGQNRGVEFETVAEDRRRRLEQRMDREPDRLPAAPEVRYDMGRVVIDPTLGN
jgi:hypothetical protein